MHHPSPILRVTLVAGMLAALSAGGATAFSGPVHDSAADLWRFEKSVPFPAIRLGTDPPSGTRDWSFDPNVRVHPSEPGEHLWPDIAVGEDGTLGVAWMDDHASGGYHIFYSSSTDEGATWTLPERIDDRAAGAYSKFVSLAFTPRGTAVAVWEDDRTGQIQLYFSKRNGPPEQPWSPNIRVNTTGGSPSGSDFMNGSLAVLDEDRYFVAWTDWREGVYHQVYLRATSDGGLTWGTEHRVSDGLGYQPVAGDPCLIVDPSFTDPGAEVLYCVTNDWRGYAPGGRYPNVYFYRSTNGGANWSIGVMVNDIEPGFQQTSSHALVKLDDGALAAGYLNNPDWTLYHLCVSRSVDAGASWSPGMQIDEPGGGGTGTYPSIATDGAYLYAGFDLYTTSWDEYLRVSPNGGVGWPYPSQRVDDDATGAAAGNVVLAVPRYAILPEGRSLDVFAAWQDNRAPGYNWKIYAAHGEALGQSVPEPAPPAVAGAWRIVPNPSRAVAAVSLVATGPGAPARVLIVDAAGRSIRALDCARGGTVWDGRDARGDVVPAGLFWIRAASGNAPLVRLR